MEPRVSFITLGVSDLKRSTAFYSEVLRLPIKQALPEVTFFEMGKTWLALYPRELLAKDAGVSAEGSGFNSFALAHNVATEFGVDELLCEVEAGGGKILKPARKADWGGRSGYFADPDGFLWEVAWNPQFPHV